MSDNEEKDKDEFSITTQQSVKFFRSGVNEMFKLILVLHS